MNLLRRLTPFIVLALFITLFGFGLMLLFYLILFAFIISFVIYIVNLVKVKFFHHRSQVKTKPKKTGRVIDSDEWHHL